MTRPEQIALLRRLLHYLDTKTTFMADAPWCNDVSIYTDPDQATSEAPYSWASPLIGRHPARSDRRLCRRADRDRPSFRRKIARVPVCRHRGAKIAQGSGQARLFVCPYHA
jgi:Rieske [2Fe-2S] domain